MAIRADSYSNTSQVKVYTRYLLKGEPGFNSTTTPTGPEVEGFIDEASATLNVALRGAGLAAPITNSTAKLVCDSWVRAKVVEHVELTQRGEGYGADEGSRTAGFRNLHKAAQEFVKMNLAGFRELGVPVTRAMSAGLQFTGLAAKSERSDPGDSSLAQPAFGRDLFEDGTVTRFEEAHD